MRRVLVGIAVQAVAVTAMLVGLSVAGLLLWPGDPLKSLTDDPSFEGTPLQPIVLAVLAVVVLVASAVSFGVASWAASRRARRVGQLLSTLGERAERLGAGDSRPVPLSSDNSIARELLREWAVDRRRWTTCGRCD